MMAFREWAAGVSWAGVVDWDRRLFDALIPIPEGTSYNAYLVRGETYTALIDSVDTAFAEAWMAALPADLTVDYLVSNHAEQDHSGALPLLMERFPKAPVLCTPKARSMLPELLRIAPDRLRAVEDGETLDLGGGRRLRFVHLPWVHWPETMGVFLEPDEILFSCDFFGSHLATTRLFADEDDRTGEQARLYYAQIMMPYAPAVRKNLERVKALAPRIIAPSHGPVWRSPGVILDRHDAWLNGPPSNRVVLARVSMHGSSGRMAEVLEAELVARGVEVRSFDLSALELGRMASALVDAGTIVFACGTVWAAPHPMAAMAMMVASGLKPKARQAALIGSYGWSPKGFDDLAARMPGLKAEWLPPVLSKGWPGAEVERQLGELAGRIAEGHAAAGLA